MTPRFLSIARSVLPVLVLTVGTLSAGAQDHLAAERRIVETSGDSWWLTIFFVAVALLFFGSAVFLWNRSKRGLARRTEDTADRYSNYYSQTHQSYELDNVDAEMELEWLRKAKKTTKPAKSGARKEKPSRRTDEREELNLDARMFQEKMRRLQYVQLPINSFSQLAPAKGYAPLPTANDAALLSAIEQANEEFEEDEAVRELALKVLAMFRTTNSVEALAQIALYDLSSNLRSKAVTTLTEFDHESVFETILLACADPTREVRAAAARGLFRLSFDRAHAWKRLLESDDAFRMTHAARAAIEAGIVTKSLDRLIHEDVKVAYEAFALTSLLIRAGETREIFEAVREHKDERVKFALLHVIKVHKDDRMLGELVRLQREVSLPAEVAERMRETVKSFEAVTANAAWTK